MAVLNQLRLPDGRTVKVEEWGELPFHSTALIAADQTQDVYFWNYGKGENFPGTTRPATELDTSMDKGGQIIGGEMFVFAHTLEPVQTMTTYPDPPAPQIPTVHEMLRLQLKETLSLAYLIFTLANKSFAEGLLHWFPAGGGPSGFDVNTGASIFTNGVASPVSIRRYNIPVHIASSQEVIVGKIRFPLSGLVGGSQEPPAEYVAWRWVWKFEGLRRRQVV